jgi:hypothetical protein
MSKVLFKPEVLRYSERLVQILYDYGYFGFKDSAKKYVKELFDDITDSLPIRLKKPAPKNFEKYGKNMQYASFRTSKQTSWYVFFETYEEHGEVIYLIRYISNNHVIAKFL